MQKVLLAAVFLLPILALIFHMLLNKKIIKARMLLQSILMISWSGLCILLFFTQGQPIAITLGNWPAPFGITLLLDQLGFVMLVVFSVVAVSINFYSYQDSTIAKNYQAFYAGFWLLLIGVSGAILTADIFNLYVWFEVILVSAFILLATCRNINPDTIMHYAIMNITGTLLMLLAIALLYGLFGTLNYGQISYFLLQTHSKLVVPILCLLLFAVGLKGAIFPLYFWLPKAYPKTSLSATMLLSSMVTKMVMMVLLRLVWLWFPLQEKFISTSLLVVAIATMLFGVLGAACQQRFKEVLAFHIVSQLGYILLAITLPVPQAIIAAVFFVIHNILVKTNLFMIAGILQQHLATDCFKKLGQILKDHKWLATAFFLAAMSLAGFPPFSGFWAKFLVIKSALVADHYFSAVFAIIVSLFTLYSMIKIWRYVFCEQAALQPSNSGESFAISFNLLFPVLLLLSLSLAIGVFPDSLLRYLQPIESQLQNPNMYIQILAGNK